MNYYRNNISRLSEKLIALNELLKIKAKITIAEVNHQKHLDTFKEITASLAEACEVALPQPIAGKQYVLMTDANCRASAYGLVIEENDERNIISKRKTIAQVAF